jgi:ectoine hydroxylase-related dioxygenase (phytanoyl-CoA dioxygenase family)
LQAVVEQVGRDGYAIAGGLLSEQIVSAARGACPPVARGGLRNVLRRMPEARAIAESAAVREIAAMVLGAQAWVVRAILFDKTQGANWALGFHQDTTIAVAERVETPGFGPWSIKDGVVHVQPPAEVLARMVTVRVHLDDADASNGALAVIPGSHRFGLLETDAIREMVGQGRQVSCDVHEGDAVVMRPLLLHGSPRATREAHRRVMHLEFAANELPGQLRWAKT